VPRTGKIIKRKIEPDPIHQSPQVAKLINIVMVSGKKTVAQKIVYETLENIKAKNMDPIKTYEQALENIMPRMEVRPRRVGGASYMVPSEVRGPRKQSLAIRWLIDAARSRSSKDVERIKNKPLMISKLTAEILDAANGTGKAVSKREEMNRMADANKAFAHFRW
jgi:small subunit ribosomal protein S7